MKKSLNRNYLINFGLILSSFLFLALAFEKKYLNFFVFMALVPFFFLLEHVQSRKSAFLTGWILGTGFFLTSFRWLLSLSPNEILGLDYSITGFFLVIFIWIYLSLALGLSFAVFGFIAKYLDISSKKLSLIIVIPSIWIVLEYIKAWIFSLVTWGEGATLGPYWTFGNLGYLLADTPFFYFSRLFGLYGLSFLAVMINAGVFLVLKRYPVRCLLCLYLIIFIFLSSFYFFAEYSEDSKSILTEGRPVRVLLLGINSSKENFLYRQSFLDLLKETEINFSNQPDLVVFPESFYLFSVFGQFEKLILEKLFPDKNQEGFIVANRTKYDDRGNISEIIYRDSEGNFIASKQKSFLIPGGEVLPVIIEKLMFGLGLEENIRIFKKIRKIERGNDFSKSTDLGGVKIGAFLCSGVISPNFSRDLIRDGAEIIINSASYNLFNSQPFLLYNIELMARFQAMAYKRPFIQSTYGGPTFIINEKGNIVKKSSKEKTEILSGIVYPQNRITFSVKLGDFPVILSALLIIIIFGFRLRSRKCL